MRVDTIAGNKAVVNGGNDLEMETIDAAIPKGGKNDVGSTSYIMEVGRCEFLFFPPFFPSPER